MGRSKCMLTLNGEPGSIHSGQSCPFGLPHLLNYLKEYHYLVYTHRNITKKSPHISYCGFCPKFIKINTNTLIEHKVLPRTPATTGKNINIYKDFAVVPNYTITWSNI